MSTAISEKIEPSAADVRWNFAVIVLDVTFFLLALAFVDATTVIPTLLTRLGAAPWAIGALGTVQSACWMAPPIVVAALVEHKERKKPLVLWAGLVSRLSVPVFAVALLMWHETTGLVLGSLFVCWAGLHFFDAVTGIPWTDITGKAIPDRIRGKFYGSMQLMGGALAFMAGFGVRRILADKASAYPNGYALLFGLASASLMVSWFFLSLLREPLRGVQPGRRGLRALIADMPGLLRRYRGLKEMWATRLVLGASALATPFYAVYARLVLHTPESAAGTFLSAQVAGGVAGAMLLGHVNDKYGSTRAVSGTAAFSAVAPIAALLLPAALGDRAASAFPSVFCFLGAAMASSWIGSTNFLLEAVDEKDRPATLALFNILTSPLMAMPILGGWLVEAVSFQVVFGLAAVGAVCGLALSLRLKEPRQARQG
jgi:MFS family permease